MPEINENTSTPAADRAGFDATRPDRGLRCYACEKIIADGAWFARIKVGDTRVAFCSPRCVEKFLAAPETYNRHLDQQPYL